ncbi:MAG: hypothetical protein KC561_03170, partial [Myxococcales bacterium]|nr:hypothetical protein [Myxococcales bacterium]
MRERRISSWVCAAMICLAVLLAPTQKADAQHSAGVQGGYNLVTNDWFVGAHARYAVVRLGTWSQFVIYPNFDLYVFDDISRYSFDFDFLFPFNVPYLRPYAGFGMGITYTDLNPGEETRGDLNLIGGVNVDTGTVVQPFMEVEASVFGTDVVAVSLGVTFVFGDLPPWSSPEYVPEIRPMDDEDDLSGMFTDPEVATGPTRTTTPVAGDRDSDGIRDTDDECPDEPETFNGIRDQDGCPDI